MGDVVVVIWTPATGSCPAVLSSFVTGTVPFSCHRRLRRVPITMAISVLQGMDRVAPSDPLCVPNFLTRATGC
jgi:hypothetical protein